MSENAEEPRALAVSTETRKAWQLRLGAVLLLAAAFVLLLKLPTASNPLSNVETQLASALSSGAFGLALGMVFLGGVGTAMTPCVYPMIAVTVSIFGARTAKSRTQGALLSASFVLGIAALFTPLGLIAARTGGAFASFLSSPSVAIGIAVMFGALGLSMLGLFEIALPSGLRNRLNDAGGVGYRGAFVLGMASALIAAPCTGPVLLFLLGWVASSGNVLLGTLCLFVYALGLGSLFFVVGTFAVSLPKSGAWLDWVKSIFAMVMFTVALWYIRDLLPLRALSTRSMGLIAFAALATAIGILAGAIDLPFDREQRALAFRKVPAMMFAVVGLFGLVLYMTALEPGARIPWRENIADARRAAKTDRRPLLVDFGASWCGACGELDRDVFADPRVVREASRFVPIRVDLSTGKATPEKYALLKEYNQRGLPLVVMHDSQGIESARLVTYKTANEFLELMRTVR